MTGEQDPQPIFEGEILYRTKNCEQAISLFLLASKPSIIKYQILIY